MHLLNTYDDQQEAETAEKSITGKKRLASDRDDNEIVYRLFGDPTWSNFYQLGMFDLPELEQLLDTKKAGNPYDQDRHQSILQGLNFAVNTYQLTIPSHWR